MNARTFTVSVTLALAVGGLSGCSKENKTATRAPSGYGHEALARPGHDRGAAPPMAGTTASPAADEAVSSREAPGLGTAYGEQRYSRVVSRSFTRGSSAPDVTLALRYNDPQSLPRSFHGGWGSSSVSTPDGAFVLSLVDERGHELPAVDIDSKRYAVGEPGQRYLLGIENHSRFRYEVVASVDGLDVIDGGDASFEHRGYILEPFSSVVVDGWRTSDDTVAAFRFSSIDDSYAERRGRGRNIGVIGAAFFHEESAVPWNRIDRRHDADPFPGRYAPPPPPRRTPAPW